MPSICWCLPKVFFHSDHDDGAHPLYPYANLTHLRDSPHLTWPKQNFICSFFICISVNPTSMVHCIPKFQLLRITRFLPSFCSSNCLSCQQIHLIYYVSLSIVPVLVPPTTFPHLHYFNSLLAGCPSYIPSSCPWNHSHNRHGDL